MIGIIDYGFGNIKSISNALKKIDVVFKLIKSCKELDNFKKIILPGVGSFSPAMDELLRLGFVNEIKEFASDQDNLILGICLGMQLLTSKGFEDEKKEGFNLITGEAQYLNYKNKNIHHVGWNNLKIMKKNKILKDVKEDLDFYFCHSIVVNCKPDYVVSETTFKNTFPSIINKDNIYGIQFHPEKSHIYGLKILKNFSCM